LGAVRGQKIYNIKGFKIITKIKTKKNSKYGDFLILFLKFFLKPLTLTLSPQAGRGDWREFFFCFKKKFMRVSILI
jgi:hypothetical protein